MLGDQYTEEATPFLAYLTKALAFNFAIVTLGKLLNVSKSQLPGLIKWDKMISFPGSL